ncbi:MAG TPA: alpha/beta hydrolase family protein [Bacteroidales bacterium]|jgi:hypothetical protein|nr:alpha/beta hydrolase family protein [Bacteroidales bacterium]HQH25588.1 alpha/beta hydrolase family protein [Bacteroidales bacterium]HQJ83468.1 alpha/beta hydrolase family protein [Bacteroidales bacterium]
MIKNTTIFVLFLSLYVSILKGQTGDELNILKNNWLLYSDAANSLYHHLTGEAYKLLDKRAETINQLRSAGDWQKRQEEVRRELWDIIGPFPEKTPLNARITGKVRKKGYSIENVIYESLPGLHVTASLFIPDNIRKPAPAILFCCGHSHGAYRLEYYQLPLLNLVKKGFIVLAFDPLSQGERLQYFDPGKGESLIGSSTKEHSYPAVQVFLNSKSIARYFIWDGIRGIDYLVSRREVDPQRIGVHGLSGGGTQTAYISALDDRVAASAPAGYITGFRRLLQSIGVQDGEQNLYHQLTRGIDHADYIELRAPRPTLIMATTRDFFSIQGTRETYEEVKRAYTMLGAPGNIEITEDDCGHDYTRKNREAMYAFFQKHLGLPGSSSEEEVDFATEQELQKTSTGQLSTSLEGLTVFDLNKRESEPLLAGLEAKRKNYPEGLSDIVTSAGKLSGFIYPSGGREPVFAGRFQRDDYAVEKYFVKGEGNYVIPYLLIKPRKPGNKAVICLYPGGKPEMIQEGGEIEWFVRNGFTVLVPDIIGTGETGPGIFRGDAVIMGVSNNMWFTSVITGKSIAGIRAADIIRLRMLLTQKEGIREVYGLAVKEMTPVMLHASAFDQEIAGTALVEPLSSYRSIALNPFYHTGFVHNIVAGALTGYDLPDLAGTIAPRKLLMIGTTDGTGEGTGLENTETDLEVIRNCYRLKNASGHLSIIPDYTGDGLFEQLADWIK